MNGSEKELWAAVIDRALMDATETCGKSVAARMERDRAREWLTTPSRDLEEVCALAGIESSRVIATASAKIAAAKASDPDEPLPPAPPRLASNALYHHEGRAMTIKEWEAETGVSRKTIYSRIKRGEPIGQALTRKIRRTNDRGVVGNFGDQRPDRSFPIAQETT